MNNDIRKNSEGYDDPTAYAALKNVDGEEARLNRLLGVIFYITNLAGFRIEERIIFRDKRSGKLWK